MGLRAALTEACWTTTRWAGLHAFARYQHRRSLTVLCYHGVVPALPPGDPMAAYTYRNTIETERFDAQMAAVAKTYHPVDLDAVTAAATSEGPPLPDRALLVTFDDGYRNNLEHALPILQAHGVPAAVSVSTGYIGRSEILWPLEVDLRVLSVIDEAEIPMPTAQDGDPPSSAPPNRVTVPRELDARVLLARQIRARCKRIPDDQRQAYLETLRRATPEPLRCEDRDAFCTWDEVRQLRDAGIAIASHTVSHPILSQTDPTQLQHELETSKREIERELKQPCRAFVYPNGSSVDMTELTLAAIRAADYDIALTLRDAVNVRGLPDPLAIDRISVPNHTGIATWSAYVSGLRSALPGGRR